MGGGLYITMIGEYLKVNKKVASRSLNRVPESGEAIDQKFYFKAQVIYKDPHSGRLLNGPPPAPTQEEGDGEEDAPGGDADADMPEAHHTYEHGQGSSSFPDFSEMRSYLESRFEEVNDHIAENHLDMTGRLESMRESMNEFSYYQRGQQAQLDWNYHQHQLQRRFFPEEPVSLYNETAYPLFPAYAPGMPPPPPYDPVQAFIDAYGYHPDQQPPS